VAYCGARGLNNHRSMARSAMAAGIENQLRSMEDVVALIDARSAKISGEALVG